MTTRTELWKGLVGAGIAAGAPPASAADASPWYVNAMIGVAAWIASVFLLAFFFLAIHGLLRNPGGVLAIGAVLCVAGVIALRAAKGQVFVTQLGLAASLAGQAMIAFGLVSGDRNSSLPWLAFAVVEAALVAVAPHAAHRVLATLAASYAICFALWSVALGALFPALIAAAFVLAQALGQRASEREAVWSAVAAGLALASLLVIPAMLGGALWWSPRAASVSSAVVPAIAAAALIAVLLFAIARILRDAGVALSTPIGIASLAGGLGAGLAAWAVPAVIVSLVVLLGAYAAGRRALAGLAIAAMVVAIAHYYYSMELTLLAKSAALFATGAVLLAAGLALRFLFRDEEPAHA